MTTNPWLVPITAIRRHPGTRRRESRCASVGELQVAGTTVAASAAADVEVVLDVIDGGIEVSGTVAAPWVGECRRCLRPVEGVARAEVRELYRPPDHVGDPDEESYPLVGEQLDLEPMVRDALLLELPLAPLCEPECPGLCATCGERLDSGLCRCPTVVADPRWAALDVLRPGGTG